MGLFSTECSHCGSKEHASDDCPHGVFSSKCIHCGSTEHASDDCPHGLFSSKCIHCGSRNHASDDCPHGIFSSKCRHCGSLEHSTDNCPHGVFSSKCNNCGSKNHSTDNCPHGISNGSRNRSNSPTSSETDGASSIGWLIGVGVVIFAIIWLAVNVVLPVILLNSALIFTILAATIKKHRVVFAIFAFFGGGYMLLDIINGWFSANFIHNVVKDAQCLDAFVYINSLAIGLSAWFLLQPIWLNAKKIENADKRRSLIMKSSAILIIAIAVASSPVIFYGVKNAFSKKSVVGNGGNNSTNYNYPKTESTDIGVTNGNTSSGVTNSTPSIHGRFPQTSERIISYSDLAGLSKQELSIMRNEIFARHGYIFKTTELKSYFSQQPWYSGVYDDVSAFLSTIERDNAAFIKQYEN